MNIRKIEAIIEGVTPLLMHGMGIEAQERLNKKSRKMTDIPTPEKEAEEGCYRMKSGELFIPARCVKAMLIKASGWYKFGKKSARQFIAGAVRVEPYEIGLGTSKFDIDRRPVVVQKARIIRSRACLQKWRAKFYLVYNADVVDDRVLKEILEDSGIRIGLLDNRPATGGENGTFKIVSWKVAKG